MVPVLETNRLILREIRQADINNLFSIFSSKELTKYYGSDAFETKEQAEELVRSFAANYQEKKAIRWGSVRPD